MNPSPTKTDKSLVMSFDYTQFKFTLAYPTLGIKAGFKKQAEDFVVEEHLPFDLSGEGEHVWLQIRKRNTNTDWLAQQLAKHVEVKSVAVGYAGLKDRHAVTTQWFSIYLPGKPDPDFSAIESDEVEILQSLRHSRKLQRGALSHNQFEIRLRKPASEQADVDVMAQLESRCRLLAEQGVPNYYGEQRFGRDRGNLLEAERMFARPKKRLPRHKRSLYLSAARSWLFNHILSTRITQSNWNRRLPGDVFMLDGKSACFRDDATEELEHRLERGEIHPVGSLYGDGESMCAGEALALEQTVFEVYPQLTSGLRAARLEPGQRALRLMPINLQTERDEKDFLVRFSLPAGAYATTVLRELLDI